MEDMGQQQIILFFDGVCGLCNGLVDWLLPRDGRAVLKYATLQGATAKELLPPEMVTDLNTVVLWHRGRVLTRSDAILSCLSELGGLWRIVGMLKIVPRPLRDGAYNFIARRRYLWFGQRHTCRMPLPGERLRFLD